MIKLLRTLASSPHLAAHVHRLSKFKKLSICCEILTLSSFSAVRDFPKALFAGERAEVLEVRLQALRNCVNLQSCAWTRDGSLTTDVLNALTHSQRLSELELNGRNQWRYDPEILCNFSRLRKITLIMPSGSVADVIPRWTAITKDTLEHLTLICHVRLVVCYAMMLLLMGYGQSSTVITDRFLKDISLNLVNLKKLYLVGCPKVTHTGITHLISHNISGLIKLGLEGVHPKFVSVLF